MHQDITNQILVEEKIKASESRYRNLLENANDIIYSHDLQGKYLSINNAGEKITGYSREDILGGMNMTQIVAPEHLEMAKKMIERKFYNSSPTVYELDIFARDGRRLTLEVSTRLSSSDGQPTIEGIARDITERKQAEREKLQLAEQVEKQRKHLQEMVSSIPGVVWEAWGEPDDAMQRIDFVSEYVETMLGYSVEEWLATPNFWLSIVHLEDKESAILNASETFASRKTGTNRFRWIAKSGKVIWVESQSVAICDETGNPIGMRGVTMDISERKQKEANERFLAEASTTLASSLDYETTLSTVARLAVPHFADWCGVDIANENGTLNRLAVAHIDPEKIVWAHEIYKHYQPDPNEPQGLYNVFRSGESEFYPDIPDELLVQSARDEEHLKIMRQIGFCSVMLVPLKVRGGTLGVLTFVNSESSRHHSLEDLVLAEDLANRAALAVDNARLYRAEQQTRQTAERTSDLLRRLQSVSESLSQALTPDQVATAVVEQGLNSLGAHAGTVVCLTDTGDELEIVGTVNFSEEIVNKWKRFPLSDSVPIADAIREKAPVIVESFAEWKEHYPGLGPLASVTGSQALVAFPLIVEGRMIGAMGLSFPKPQKFSDDDRAFMLALAQQCAQALERARLYETEQQLRTQAEAANRMKDEFLATVSHELRTPLTAIVGWSNMLITNKFSQEVTSRAIQTIERNAKAQAQIIEDLLDVSRIITGKLNLNSSPIQLELIIKTALESLQPAADGKEIKIKSNFDSEPGIVFGDMDRLQQVMWNLLSNAIKFTPEGGEVNVAMENGESHLYISVSDTGRGIEKEFLPFVFERFSQADGTSTRKYGGLGLGLAIVRHLVELHGGTVKVESAGINRGTTFTVSLPLLTRQESDANLIENPAATVKDSLFENFSLLKDLRILIVDDEADTRLLLTTIIEGSGANARTANSAVEAFQILGEFKPHLLISDIAMPEEDGYSLIQKLRNLSSEEGSDIPAIALTAYAREEDRNRALEAGFQRHLAKPINPDDLIVVISELVDTKN
jgi:PAS domain S-box-containing protein